MNRHRVELVYMNGPDGDSQTIFREHDVVYYTDCEGYGALICVPRTSPLEVVHNLDGYGTLDELKRAVELHLRRDALDLVNVRVRVRGE